MDITVQRALAHTTREVPRREERPALIIKRGGCEYVKRYVELNVIHISTLYREKEHQELTKKVDDFQRELR